MTNIRQTNVLLLLATLAVAGCTSLQAPSGPPPSGTYQGSAAPPLQTESERMMMQNAPVTRPTPQPRSTY
jgi:hypothetical protein